MPAGFPKGQAALHDREGDRRARLRAEERDGGERARRVLGRRLEPRHARRGHRRRERGDDRGWRSRVSGVAPRAYLGNYKVFVETDSGLSPNANSPAIVAAIEAAVADGMDVINFSGGEPEIEPSRDIVALALDAAAAAGVVPVVAAGNDYNDFGAGSVSSPANSDARDRRRRRRDRRQPDDEDTCRVLVRRPDDDLAAAEARRRRTRRRRPVVGPGRRLGRRSPGRAWPPRTSPAPRRSCASATRRGRSSSSSPRSSSRASTRRRARNGSRGPRFQGGGVVALQRADRPLLFAQPTALSFGLLDARDDRRRGALALDDAGGGAGHVAGRAESCAEPRGVRLVAPADGRRCPGRSGRLTCRAARRRATSTRTSSSDARRGRAPSPGLGRVTAAALARHDAGTLSRPGVYRARRRPPVLVSRYRYPETPSGIGVTTTLRGPERVFRFRIAKRVANAGVVVTQRGRGSRVEPRIVAGLDENRLTGYAGLPVNHNPYMDEFRERSLAAGVLSPRRASTQSSSTARRGPARARSRSATG